MPLIFSVEIFRYVNKSIETTANSQRLFLQCHTFFHVTGWLFSIIDVCYVCITYIYMYFPENNDNANTVNTQNLILISHYFFR